MFMIYSLPIIVIPKIDLINQKVNIEYCTLFLAVIKHFYFSNLEQKKFDSYNLKEEFIFKCSNQILDFNYSHKIYFFKFY